MTTATKRKHLGQRRQPAAAPANETSRRRPDLRPQHFLGLKDSTLVATDTLLQIKDTVIDTIESRAMSVIYGDPGLGKSFSTRATIQEMNPDLILPLDFARSRPGPKGPARGAVPPDAAQLQDARHADRVRQAAARESAAAPVCDRV
ncbi:hypothetical protein ABZ800_35170 [Streptomyces sp. NPDC047813]|uniref:hypothetical protein n=1 Tax=Streptomyces sp. NPDC047813 TaxID=3154608 RepID=UPI0033DA2F7C